MASILKVCLVVLYVFLVIKNYNCFKNDKYASVLTIITLALSTILLFSANAADLDWSEVELDISGYRTIYEKYLAIDNAEYNMYWAFYRCMYLGQILGLSYRTWWAVMSVLAMSVIVISCKVHKYDINLFLASFMAYYEFVLYSGFKFFYGFCFLLLAYGFLLRNTNKSRLLYVLFVSIAGGFHVLYYIFFILLIKPRKNPKLFVSIVVTLTVILTVLMRVSGSAMSYMAPFFNMINNDHINIYTQNTVHMGFYIAIVLHLVLIYIVFRIKRFTEANNGYDSRTETLYYTVLLSLVFCPFYAVALTFMRFISSFSLVAITAAGGILRNSAASRTLGRNMSILMVASYWFMQLAFMGSFIKFNVIPFFDVF